MLRAASLVLLLTACSQDFTINTEENVFADTRLGEDEGIAFEQALDILLVVDESGSMYQEQSMLRKQLPLFFDVLNSKLFSSLKWTFKIASASSAEEIIGEVSYLDNDPVAELDVLASQLDSLCGSDANGQYCESGLDATLTSMYNDSYQENADLLTIWLSDEPDYSSVTPEYYLEQIANFKQPPFAVLGAALVYQSTKETCWDDSVEVGTGYIEAANKTVSLCSPELWPQAFDLAIDHVPNLNRFFYLEEIPFDWFNIIVELNGTNLPEELWEYHAIGNYIEFEDQAVPPPGTKIEVTYQVEV